MLSRRGIRTISMSILCWFFVAGCATYQTPGAGVNVGNLSKADESIAEVMKREPAAHFPARVSIARVQGAGYHRSTAPCYGYGRYCLVTVRDVEAERDLERIARLPMIAGVAPMNRMLLSEKTESVRDLRMAAAGLKTDLILLYSLDTHFNVDSTQLGPLSMISLGFLPNKKAYVTATASAALVDVRTGFLYGVAEASAKDDQRATAWSTNAAVESSRIKAEAEAFRNLIAEVEKLWKGVVEEHAVKATVQAVRF